MTDGVYKDVKRTAWSALLCEELTVCMAPTCLVGCLSIEPAFYRTMKEDLTIIPRSDTMRKI